jgi:DNA-binding beta-propeller fold protein YncE
MGTLRARALSALVVFLSLSVLGMSGLAAAPAGADPVGELTFQSCVGPAAGCVGIPSSSLSGANSVIASSTGSVYVAGSEAVTHFFAGTGLSYDGCVSSDGSSGKCADTPGAATLTNEIFQGTLAVTPSGRSVYSGDQPGGLASPYGFVSHYDALAEGQLVWSECASSDGAGGCQTLSGETEGPLKFPTGLAMSPDGHSLYVSTLNGSLLHFIADPTSGNLSYEGCVAKEGNAGKCASIPGEPLERIIALAISPISQVYTLSEAAAISHFRTSPGGALTYDGCIGDTTLGGACARDTEAQNPLFSAFAIAISPGGGIYTVSDDGLLAHFPTDSEGRIFYQGCVSDNGSAGTCGDIPGSGSPLQHARAVAASPDGKSLYVATRTSLLTFELAPEGQITFKHCFSNHSIPECAPLPGVEIEDGTGVAVSPDGSSVYLVGSNPAYVAHFSRAQATTIPPPTCQAFAATTPFGQATALQLQCTDVLGAPLTAYALVASPAHGTAALNTGTGAVTYTPAPGYSGLDTFTFDATSSHGTSAAATATITIGAPPGGGGVQPPAITAASLANKRFRVGKQATAISAKKTPLGTTFRFTLSAVAKLQITITHTAAGLRSGHSCLAPSARLKRAHAKRCTRTLTVGTLTRASEPQGADSIAFSGRIGHRALSPQPYQAVLSASNTGGRSKPVTLSFAIVH